MESILLQKLSRYIVDHNPELIINDTPGYSLASLLRDKINAVKPMLWELIEAKTPEYIIVDTCFSLLIADLRPSKANYIKNLLETEFPAYFYRWQNAGILTYETLQLMKRCEPLFIGYGFNEQNVHNKFLKNAMIEQIRDYLVGEILEW